jgi:Amt family ammonium transporter
MDTNAVLDLMWVLICGILVFFHASRFYLVETGFTRSKKGNIIMKKFNGFCIVVVHSGQWILQCMELQ